MTSYKMKTWIITITVLTVLLVFTQLYAQTLAETKTASLSAPSNLPQDLSSGVSDEKADIVKSKLQRKISLDLRNMDIIDVYKFLAVKGDLNVVINKEIAGRVTLLIKEVSIEDALQIISIANNLAYKVISEIIYVMSETEHMAVYGKRFNDKSQVKIAALKYAKPSYVLEALKNIKSDIGKIIIDEDTGTVIMVDTKEKLWEMQDVLSSLDHPQETKVYSLQYANAEDVAAKLKEKIDVKSVGMVQADVRSNQLVVSALPQRFKEIESVITGLDKPTKAVLIEARLLQITLNPRFDYGVNWDRLFRTLKLKDHGLLALSGTFPIDSTLGSTVGQIGLGKVDPDAIELTIKLLKQVETTKILANPKIMVTNNKEAKIHIGDRLVYVTTTTSGDTTVRATQEVHFIDTGVNLTVTPTINDDGMITMVVAPEISSKTGDYESTILVGSQEYTNKIPEINSTTVSTTVIVEDGATVVIGGLRRDDKEKERKGIPVLMDIPGIRWLFSNEDTSYKQTEIVIFLTPRIVSGKENVIDQLYETKIKPRKEYE